jgi:hypothetical protein
MGIGVANTASWAERNKRRRERAHLLARCKEDGTLVPERIPEVSPIDLEEDSDRREGTALPGTGSDCDRNKRGTDRRSPTCEGKVAGKEEITAATEVVPTSFKACVAGGELRQMVNVTAVDWAEMEEVTGSMGGGAFPDLVVGFTMRPYTGSGPIQMVPLVSGDGIDLPKPTSWDCLVEHVGRGGLFQRAVVLHGGMDPAKAQRSEAYGQHDTR